MGLLGMQFSLWYRQARRDYNLDKKTAHTYANFIEQLEVLDKIQKELEIAANRERPDVKKADKLLAKQRDIAEKITSYFKQISMDEFAQYQKNLQEPWKAMEDFLAILGDHINLIKNPILRSRVQKSLEDMEVAYNGLREKLDKDLLKVADIYSHEIMGVTSAYAHAVGSVDQLASIAKAQVVHKEEIDGVVKKVLEHVKAIRKQLESALKGEDFESAYANVVKAKPHGEWFTVGEHEYRQVKNGRWHFRRKGTGRGLFVSKDHLKENAIFHFPFIIQLIDSYEKNFESLVSQIWQRSEIAFQILSHTASIEHQVFQAVAAVDLQVEHWLAGNKQAAAHIAAVLKEEQKNWRKGSKWVLGVVQTLMAGLAGSQQRHRKAIALTTAAVIAISAVGAPAEEAEKVSAPAQVRAEQMMASREVVELVKASVAHQFKIDVTDTVHFPFDVSTQTLENAQEMQTFLPGLMAALTNAAHQAHYSDVNSFIQQTDLRITLEIRGRASIDGRDSYNLNLSAERAAFVEAALRKMLEGSPLQGRVAIVSVKAEGEQGQAAFVAAVTALLQKAKSLGGIRPLVNALQSRLNHHDQNQLIDLLNRYVRGGPPGTQEGILSGIAELLREIAGFDAYVLAPYRAVEITTTFNFTEMEGKVCKVVILVKPDSDPIEIPPLFWNNAILIAQGASVPKGGPAFATPRPSGKEMGKQRPKWGAGRGRKVMRQEWH